MAKRYLVVSDLHLADIEDHEDGWRAYKSSRYVIDMPFAALVRRFVERGRTNEPLTLVLNGDIFDFDLCAKVPSSPPWPVSPLERAYGLEPTAEKSAWKLEYMLGHHPGFVATLCDFITAGNQVVYILGNHDRELHFPEVREVLTGALRACAESRGQRWPAEGLRFEPWFYYIPGELYVEHGHQFDHYSSFKDILDPTVQTKAGPAVAVPMGNLSNRYLAGCMGFFNPHATDFILNMFAYLRHWLEHYAFSRRRHIVLSWFCGCLIVISKLLDIKKRLLLAQRSDDSRLASEATRTGVPLGVLRELKRLQTPPMTNRLFRVLREFWLDRLLLSAGMLLGTVVVALLPVPLWAKVMVPVTGFPLLFFVYEWFAQGETIFTVEQRLPRFARAIAERLPVRIVSFGHTHRPRVLPLGDGVSFVDSGSWAPLTERLDPSRLAPGTRNYLEITFNADEVQLTLDAWTTPVLRLAHSPANDDDASDRFATG